MSQDPEEFVGTTQEKKADPKGVRTVAPAAPHPGTAKPVYTPPVAAPGVSHKKHAVLGPARRLDDAEVALNAANLELQNATHDLRNAEMVESAALDAFNALLPGPTADEVYREKIAREQAAKLARVKQGLPAVEPKVVTARSPIDIAASQRPRTSPQAVNQPLRSPVARRVV